MAWIPARGELEGGWYAASGPVWGPWLQASDLPAGLVPTNDPSAQLVSIAAVAGVDGAFDIETRGNGVATDGYQEGARWDVTPGTAWSLEAAGMILDGTMGVALHVELLAPPAAGEGHWAGIGLRGDGVTSGVAAAVQFSGGSRSGMALRSTSRSSTGADAAYAHVLGLVSPVVGRVGDAPLSMRIDVQAALATGQVTASDATTTTASAPTATLADYRLFLCAGCRTAASGARTIRIRARWAVVRLRPAIV